MSKFYVQFVFKKTYSNGAVRFEYLPSQILRYDRFEYESPLDIFSNHHEHVRFQRVYEAEEAVIEAILKPAPELVIFQQGNFVSPKFQDFYQTAERTSTWLEFFEDTVGDVSIDANLETITVIETRKEL